MRSVASRRASSILASPLSLGGGGCVRQYRLEVANDGAVVLAGGGELDAARHTEVEDDDGEGVLHAEREGGGVHHLEASVEGVQVAEAQELPRRRVLRRISLVDAVNVLLGHEQYIGVDLDGAKGGGRICGDVGVAGAGGEDDQAALLQVANGAAADVRLRDGGDGDRALCADPEPVPLQRVLQGEGVDDSGQHAGVVGGGAVHAGGGGGGAAEDVPRTDDDGDLDPHALDRLQLPGDGIEHGGVDAVGEVAHEGFAAELEENAIRGVFRHRSAPQFKACEAPYAYVLARLADRFVHHVLDADRFVADERLQKQAELLGVTFRALRDVLRGDELRVGGRHLEGDALGELLEVLRAGDEVRFAVDLHQGAEAAVVVEVRQDDTFGGGALGPFGGQGVALLPQDLLRLLKLAPGLFQGVLAVQHACARQFAQLLDGLWRDGHGVLLVLFGLCGCCVRGGFGFRRRLRRGRFLGHGGLRRRLLRGGRFLGGLRRRLACGGLGGRLRGLAFHAGCAVVRRWLIRGGHVAGLAGGGDLHLLRLPGRLLGVLAGGQALQHAVGDAGGDELDGADRVVVGRDRIVDDVRVAVRVDEGDDGGAGAQRLRDGDVFLRRVDDEDAARQVRHLLDAAQVAVEANDLLFRAQPLFLREVVLLAAGAGVLQAHQVVDAALDGVEVGEGAAQPAGVDEGHAAAPGLALDRVLGLALGADEEDGLAG